MTNKYIYFPSKAHNQELQALVQPAMYHPEFQNRAEKIMSLLLQTPEQIRIGFEDVVRVAVNDNVRCKFQTFSNIQFSDMEIMVRPLAHKQIEIKELMDLLTDLKKECERKYPKQEYENFL